MYVPRTIPYNYQTLCQLIIAESIKHRTWRRNADLVPYKDGQKKKIGIKAPLELFSKDSSTEFSPI
jgi:hypothetical protein